jgi:hypothetical protein
MGRKSRLVVVMLTLIIVLLAIAGSAGAQSRATEYHATSTFLGYGDMGEWTYPGGNIHVRGLVRYHQIEADDPRAEGLERNVVNVNWNAEGVGPCWGTYVVTVSDTAWWEGTWTAYMHADGSMVGRYRGFGRGEFEGLQEKGAGIDDDRYGIIFETHGH